MFGQTEFAKSVCYFFGRLSISSTIYIQDNQLVNINYNVHVSLLCNRHCLFTVKVMQMIFIILIGIALMYLLIGIALMCLNRIYNNSYVDRP